MNSVREENLEDQYFVHHDVATTSADGAAFAASVQVTTKEKARLSQTPVLEPKWLRSVVGCWLLVVGCWLLVVGCWLLVVGCCCCLRHDEICAYDHNILHMHETTC